MIAVTGRVCKTGKGSMPYEVCLEHQDGSVTRQPVPSVRAGEEIIRRAMPALAGPPKVDPWNPC